MDTSFWDKAFPTAVGAAVGGFATIVAIAVKEWLDRRRTIQSWYEEVFIFEGVSQLIVYLSATEDLLTTLEYGDVVPPEVLEPYPRVAVERFHELFPDCVHTMVWLNIVRAESAKTSHMQPADQHGVQLALKQVRALKDHLTRLKKELVGLTINRKTRVYRIQYHKKVRPLLEELEDKGKRPTSTSAT